jgi:hypothetical protein
MSLARSNTHLGKRWIMTPSKGARCRHRRLHQLWWWPLQDPPAAPLRGPPSMSSSTSMWPLLDPPVASPKGPAINVFFVFGGGRCQTHRQHPQGVRHRHLLQLQWWPLPDPPTAPPRGPPLTPSLTSVVATAGLTGSTPKGPTIDVFFNFGGGRCWTC